MSNSVDLLCNPDVIRAIGFATSAHNKQYRKYTNEPYVNHCIAVASKAAEHTQYLPTIVAAVLHDVVEDTHIELSDIIQAFGTDVASLVEQVTDVSRPQDGNRAIRKQIDRDHLRGCSVQAAIIKLADLYDNTRTIIEYDPDFAKVYLKEKVLLMPLLTHAPKDLWNEVDQQLGAAIHSLVERKIWY